MQKNTFGQRTSFLSLLNNSKKTGLLTPNTKHTQPTKLFEPVSANLDVLERIGKGEKDIKVLMLDNTNTATVEEIKNGIKGDVTLVKYKINKHTVVGILAKLGVPIDNRNKKGSYVFMPLYGKSRDDYYFIQIGLALDYQSTPEVMGSLSLFSADSDNDTEKVRTSLFEIYDKLSNVTFDKEKLYNIYMEGAPLQNTLAFNLRFTQDANEVFVAYRDTIEKNVPGLGAKMDDLQRIIFPDDPPPSGVTGAGSSNVPPAVNTVPVTPDSDTESDVFEDAQGGTELSGAGPSSKQPSQPVDTPHNNALIEALWKDIKFVDLDGGNVLSWTNLTTGLGKSASIVRYTTSDGDNKIPVFGIIAKLTLSYKDKGYSEGDIVFFPLYGKKEGKDEQDFITVNLVYDYPNSEILSTATLLGETDANNIRSYLKSIYSAFGKTTFKKTDLNNAYTEEQGQGRGSLSIGSNYKNGFYVSYRGKSLGATFNVAMDGLKSLLLPSEQQQQPVNGTNATPSGKGKGKKVETVPSPIKGTVDKDLVTLTLDQLPEDVVLFEFGLGSSGKYKEYGIVSFDKPVDHTYHKIPLLRISENTGDNTRLTLVKPVTGKNETLDSDVMKLEQVNKSAFILDWLRNFYTTTRTEFKGNPPLWHITDKLVTDHEELGKILKAFNLSSSGSGASSSSKLTSPPSVDLEDLTAKVKEMEDELATLQAQLNQSKEKIKSYEKLKYELETTIAGNEDSMDELNAEKTRLTSELTKLKAKTSADIDSSNNALQAELDLVKDNYVKNTSQIKALQDQIKLSEKNTEVLENQIADLESRLTAAKRNQKLTKDENDRVNEANKELHAQILAFENAKRTGSEQESLLTSQLADLRKTLQETQDLRDEYKNNTEKISAELEAAKVRAEDAERRTSEKEQELEDTKSQNAQLEISIAELRTKFYKMEQANAVAEQKQTESIIELKNEIEQLKLEKNKLEVSTSSKDNEIADLNAQLNTKIGKSEGKTNELLTKIRELEAKKNELERTTADVDLLNGVITEEATRRSQLELELANSKRESEQNGKIVDQLNSNVRQLTLDLEQVKKDSINNVRRLDQLRSENTALRTAAYSSQSNVHSKDDSEILKLRSEIKELESQLRTARHQHEMQPRRGERTYSPHSVFDTHKVELGVLRFSIKDDKGNLVDLFADNGIVEKMNIKSGATFTFKITDHSHKNKDRTIERNLLVRLGRNDNIVIARKMDEAYSEFFSDPKLDNVKIGYGIRDKKLRKTQTGEYNEKQKSTSLIQFEMQVSKEEKKGDDTTKTITLIATLRK